MKQSVRDEARLRSHQTLTRKQNALKQKRGTPAPTPQAGAETGGRSRTSSEALASPSARIVGGGARATARSARGIVGRAAGAAPAAILAIPGVAACSSEVAFVAAVYLRE